jgi:thioredoxin-related protein
VLCAANPALQPARDLARDARDMETRRLPMLVLYSQANCAWCNRARREYLLPMQRDPGNRERVVLRQIDIDSDAPLTGFDGRGTTHRRFAQSEHASTTPTVVFYASDGARLGEAIVGFHLADFYGAYLDRALEASLATLRHGGQ